MSVAMLTVLNLEGNQRRGFALVIILFFDRRPRVIKKMGRLAKGMESSRAQKPEGR
jgi:hypothetical protein